MLLTLIFSISILTSAALAQEADASHTLNDFGFKLLSETTNQNNQVFSPYSIFSAFAMTYAGTANDTAQEMEDFFGFDPSIHSWMATNQLKLLEDGTKQDAKYELSIANSLWAQLDYTFLDDFHVLVSDNYFAPLQTMDFRNDAKRSRQTINNWAEDRTKGRIKNLLPDGSIDEQTRLVLTNAIYFKAAWQIAFQEQYTIAENFTLQDGIVIQTPTMRHLGQYSYSEADNFQLLSLPYQGNQTTMQIVLPNVGQFGEVMNSISADVLNQASQNSSRQRIELHMPKFEFEQAMDLKEIFSAMGMSKAFTDYQPSGECQNPNPANTDAADFSGMDGTRCLYIGGAYHKAFIAVDEKGTEAAAATAVVTMQTRATIQPRQPLILKLDRPFLFTIKHNETGGLLFVGTVMNPQQ